MGPAEGRLARGQDVRTVACGFIGSVLAPIVIWPYYLGTATPVCKPSFIVLRSEGNNVMRNSSLSEGKTLCVGTTTREETERTPAQKYLGEFQKCLRSEMPDFDE